MKISFTVYGTPQPQGSTRAFIPKGWKRPIITSTNKNLKPWRQEVAQVALDALQDSGQIQADSGPVKLTAEFYFQRPKSVRANTIYKSTRPDVDKLKRAIGDALSGIIYKDDAQIAMACISKLYGEPERAIITVESL